MIFVILNILIDAKNEKKFEAMKYVPIRFFIVRKGMS